MSQPKAQLVSPLGNVSLPGISATGVITATSLSGIATGIVTSLTGNPDLNLGTLTGTTFVGEGEGHAAGLSGTPELNLGIVTATSFVGDATGKAAGLTGTPNLNVGLITATSFVGFVTGNVTGNITGLAASVTPGVNLGVGVATALELYGDGSTLTGAGASAYTAQEITATGAETIIDLTYGNLIYYSSSSNTTIGFASTSAAAQITFIRKTDNSYTITWPDRVKWNNATTPTLINNPRDAAGQVFHFTSFDTGLTYNAWEEVNADPQTFELYSWAYNEKGELGQNNRTSYSSPTQIPGTTWNYVAADGDGKWFMSRKSDGTAWIQGYNEYGQLGLNNRTNYSSPVQLPGTNWAQMSIGWGRALATKTDGTIWSWGYNGSYGYLGLNNKTKYSSPTQIGTDTDWSSSTEQGSGLLTNSNNAFVIKSDNTLWVWGSGTYGQLGLNSQGPTAQKSSPTQLPGSWSKVFPGINATNRAMAAVKTDGTLWTWGKDWKGVNGLNIQGSPASRSSPTQIGTDTNWKQGASDGNTVYATKTDGTLWTWGENDYGGLAQGQSAPSLPGLSSPTQVGTDTTWSKVYSNNTYGGMAIKTDGTLWGWGNDTYGYLGQNSPGKEYSSPVQIPGLWGGHGCGAQGHFALKMV